MTHSLHRRGNQESLRKDYVFLCTPAQGISDRGAADKLYRILDILMDVGPANIGFYGHGSLLTDVNIEHVRETLKDNSRLRCCFDDKEKVKEVLRRIQSEDLGLSVTLSGPILELKEISRELSLTPHTINISCGCFGKVERLPSKPILEIATMCGHGMISYPSIESAIRKVKVGAIAISGAVRELGKPCTCGIFNPTRAQEILEEAIRNE